MRAAAPVTTTLAMAPPKYGSADAPAGAPKIEYVVPAPAQTVVPAPTNIKVVKLFFNLC
jgi:hypothetical protein